MDPIFWGSLAASIFQRGVKVYQGASETLNDFNNSLAYLTSTPILIRGGTMLLGMLMILTAILVILRKPVGVVVKEAAKVGGM